MLEHKFPPEISGIYNEKLANQLAKTQAAVVSLNQSKRLLHNPSLLMKPILVKEAESSSRLEGTQASIEDVYKLDVDDSTLEQKRQDIEEIRNYESAMIKGMELVKGRKKLDNFVIREVHKTLLSGVRGKDKSPGLFRNGPVWIGEKGTSVESARYIAPDAMHIPFLMEGLESFIKLSKENDINPLIACGIVHHRFEAIHPFLDGNGRTGRLLISLYLMYRDLLEEPILYASGYFEKDKDQYINELSKVDNQEAWYSWLYYFLLGLEIQAKKSLDLALNINDLYKESESKIKNLKSHVALLEALEQCFVRPIITAPMLTKYSNIPPASSRRYLDILYKEKIIVDLGKRGSKRVYGNLNLMSALQEV